MAKAKVLPEFQSNEDPEWAQEAHVAGMKNDLAAAEARVSELKDLGLADDNPVLKEAEQRVENAHKELQRLGAEKKAAKK